MTPLERAEAELRELMHGSARWHYAFAMGHGCSIGEQDEVSRAVRRRDSELRAAIAEHKT